MTDTTTAAPTVDLVLQPAVSVNGRPHTLSDDVIRLSCVVTPDGDMAADLDDALFRLCMDLSGFLKPYLAAAAARAADTHHTPSEG